MLVAGHVVDVAVPVELRHAVPHAQIAQMRKPDLEVVIFGFESFESVSEAGRNTGKKGRQTNKSRRIF